MAKKGRSQKNSSSTCPLSSRLSLNQHDTTTELHDNGMQKTQHANIQGPTKKKGRRKAKGKDGNGTPIVIHDSRIVTTNATRTIGVLFNQVINGPWITFKDDPKEQMDELYGRFKGTGYIYTCSKEEMRVAFELPIKTRYADWMSTLRNSVFHKYKTTGEGYINCPSNVSKDKPEWKVKVLFNVQNACNRDQSTIVHTIGSVPMAKYIKDELGRSGIEPSLIDCFKKFHVSKHKSEGAETWQVKRPKNFMYEKMDNKKNTVMEEQNEVNDWVIYKEVIGGPSHGRLLGVHASFSTKDAYPQNSQSCNKRMCLECEEGHKQLKDQVNTLTDKLMPNNSNNYARSGPSASMENVENWSDAQHEDQ
ncbi:hypothetical protein D8674_024629 [Pyrus ussuriensis x Pyrus communis]|uniref:Uncharacterized protein n=1 Tax=Pyrus ussuriensis x Pyrus communis TaxID=2448454 RepID=A0A5N5H604_9ROSA|nr:hypothetical protein D8674_024629 [Pyrus ussuriensis x Pyrus communis]